MKKLVGILLVLGLLLWLPVSTKAVEEDCESKKNDSGVYANCLENQIKELARNLELSQAATAPLESQLTALDRQIKSIQSQITAAKNKQIQIQHQIDEREKNVATQYLLLTTKVREYYKRLRSNSILAILLTAGSKGQQDLGYRLSTADNDRQLIIELSDQIGGLEQDKADSETNNKRLAGLQTSLDKQADFFEGEIKKAKAYQSDLSGKISSLQASILAAKSGSFITSVGDSDLADDYNASIKGFRESAPAGSFAVFSFGGYTHRKGMSQYGARGRAQNGQNYKAILKVYYGKEPVSKDTGGNISVAGYGGMDFESRYLYGIAEMPSDWNVEALKAQAVAARTFAYRYKTNNQTICTTEACQVFKMSKSNNPPDAWKQAVDQTRGQVLEDVVTYYSSTAGSFSFTSGWDTTDGGGGSNFFDKSYEKIGGSPWAYKAWYRQGYTASGSTCGKGDPWLNNEQFTDLVNAAIVLKNGNDDRITPINSSCYTSGNPYSYNDLRSKGGVSSVSSVTVAQGNGVTNEITINGSVHISGVEFKKAYNLRAPGYLRVPQGLSFGASSDFAFFNIEKK